MLIRVAVGIHGCGVAGPVDGSRIYRPEMGKGMGKGIEGDGSDENGPDLVLTLFSSSLTYIDNGGGGDDGKWRK